MITVFSTLDWYDRYLGEGCQHRHKYPRGELVNTLLRAVPIIIHNKYHLVYPFDHPASFLRLLYWDTLSEDG